MEDADQTAEHELRKTAMRRSHKVIFLLIALLALATFAFGILALLGFG